MLMTPPPPPPPGHIEVGIPYMTDAPRLPDEKCPPPGHDSVWALPSNQGESKCPTCTKVHNVGLNFGEQVVYSEETCVPRYLIVYSFNDDGERTDPRSPDEDDDEL